MTFKDSTGWPGHMGKRPTFQQSTMASDGISRRATRGVCRMCLRTRKTDTHLKTVGEVHHGFATGYIWECIDAGECERVAKSKMENPAKTGPVNMAKLETASKVGRLVVYQFFS